jgi:hypothetical protein
MSLFLLFEDDDTPDDEYIFEDEEVSGLLFEDDDSSGDEDNFQHEEISLAF